jgi:hypothetical protein
VINHRTSGLGIPWFTTLGMMFENTTVFTFFSFALSVCVLALMARGAKRARIKILRICLLNFIEVTPTLFLKELLYLLHCIIPYVFKERYHMFLKKAAFKVSFCPKVEQEALITVKKKIKLYFNLLIRIFNLKYSVCRHKYLLYYIRGTVLELRCYVIPVSIHLLLNSIGAP